jgi:hypothetical protein
MKSKNIKLIELLLLLLIVFSSCKKEKEDEFISSPTVPIISSPYIVEGDVISPFSGITIVFNYQFGRSIFYEGNNFSAEVDNIVVTDGSNAIEGSKKWSSNYDTLFFTPLLPFLPNSNVEVKLKMHWEIQRNGKWELFTENNNDGYYNVTVSCKTKDLPLFLDSVDVQVCYPLENQYHFLKKEYPKGLIKLKRNRRDLFVSPVFSENDELLVKITGKEGEIIVPASYDDKTYLVEYDMPANLSNEQVYKFELYKRNKATNNSITYYAYHFRTSQYNTFKEKFDELFPEKQITAWLFAVEVNVADLMIEIPVKTNEIIDYYESVNGLLLNIEFDLAENLWYQNNNYSKLYDLVNSGTYSLSRQKEPYGIPPTKYFEFSTNKDLIQSKLNKTQIDAGEAARLSYERCYLYYRGARLISKDFEDIYIKIVGSENGLSLKFTEEEKAVLGLKINFFDKGTYKYNIKYKIPGVDITTFTDVIYVFQEFQL